MPSDDAHQPGQPALIKTPDQLQQAKGPDEAQAGGKASRNGDGRRKPGEASPQQDGILGQLETERAHD